jgi:hypothetical protein
MPKEDIKNAVKGVTLLGQEKTIKSSINFDQPESRVRKLKNGAVVVLHGNTFEPDVQSLEIVGFDPPNLKKRT